jgi:hypothetical protein
MIKGFNVLVGGKRPENISNGFYFEPTVIEAENCSSIA